MKHTRSLVLGFATAAVAISLNASSTMAQTSTACAERRTQAIALARQINTAELQLSVAKQSFRPLPELGVTVPAGFAVQLVTDATGFMLSIKDTQTSCGLAVFTDQKFLIYTGSPLQ